MPPERGGGAWKLGRAEIFSNALKLGNGGRQAVRQSVEA